MTRAPVLIALCLLTACHRPQPQPQPFSVEALAADPVQLHTLHRQCQRGAHDDAFCVQVEQANLRRFLSGQASADEYQTLADLPPMPDSFDGSDVPSEEGP